MITRHDIREGGFDVGMLDFSDSKGRYGERHATSRAYPRLKIVESERTVPPKIFYVDGWPHESIDTALHALNLPPLPEPDLRAAVNRWKGKPEAKDPAVQAKELATENKFRWKVYPERIHKPADLERYAKRIAITELLQEQLEQEAKKGDLFGG